ncbi:MAG: Radical SAM superfamily enzyme [Promethearchaeota archaeon]|nr:MAG: Radical SAM superfamily enzyme [Candidatus Lokiarchaeota archaeon]
MKILLVNPNRIQIPPVIPIGLEYIASALDKAQIDYHFLDLCFSTNAFEELATHLDTHQYDLVGFTIRNIDSTVYFNNEFYLPTIKQLIIEVKARNIPIVLGGAGFSAMPEQILKYVGADYGIIGPAEKIFPYFLEQLKANKLTQTIYDGHLHGIDATLVHTRGTLVDYSKYMAHEGIIGFETHRGCSGICPYCMEARRKVEFRKIPHIITELKHLIAQGYSHFHLCDCEFNEDLIFSMDFCRALIEEDLSMEWTLYMKPTPYFEHLFELLSQSKAYLITLSVDSDPRIQRANKYSYYELEKIIEFCDKYNLKLAIDLLIGYLGESMDSIKRIITFFKRKRPLTVSISFNFRIFANTELAGIITATPSYHKHLSRTLTKQEGFVEPIFFSQLSLKDVEKLIEDDSLFKIAGMFTGVNYQQKLALD